MKGNTPTVPVDKVGLPIFAYHPDPLATGSVEAKPGRCACCGKDPGFVYTASIYTAQAKPEVLCPGCISDGSAAAKYEATFIDDHSLKQAGVPESVIEEVTRRTPGYHSWQGEDWQCCCGDACEFHGTPKREHLALLNPAAVEQFFSATGWSPEQWHDFVSGYEPGGSPAIYHFVCRHCQQQKYRWDSD